MEAPHIEVSEYTPILSLRPTGDNLISPTGYIDQNREVQFTSQLRKFRENPCYQEYRSLLEIAARLGNAVDLQCAKGLE